MHNQIKIKTFTFMLLFLSQLQAITFKEISSQNGISFKHQDGRTGQYHFTETAGSGLAWIDYNNDSKLDLLLINGKHDDHKLYKNTGNGFELSLNFTKNDKSESLGMGVCSADINQDGWVDFLITNYGPDKLYINQEGKSFVSKNLETKASMKQWSTSCAFADIDADGDLDLYVARYVIFNGNGNQSCQSDNAQGYCNPPAYPGAKDGLYINNGFGEFTQVKNRGIHNGTDDRALGVIISDIDQDNDMDIFVANDGSSNRLYLNDSKGYFTDSGLLSGTALNFNGVPEASMGIALGDLNNDMLQDMVLTHYSLETNTIYLNENDGNFSDVTQSYGINRTSFMNMGWGIAFADINNNGFEDLIVANGHIQEFADKIDSRQSYKQANQLFLNQSGKKLNLIPDEKAFAPINPKSSRGLALADWNNDGKIDVAINNINDTVDVFKNVDKNTNNWIGIKLIGDKINRSAVGAVVKVSYSDSNMNVMRKEIISGGSFQSQSDFRLLFGLGQYKGPIKIDVTWPDGMNKNLSIEKINHYHEITY